MAQKIILQVTPFEDFEKKKNYVLNKFTEKEIQVTILNEEVLPKKAASGNFYKFGVKIGDDYFWHFHGYPLASSRADMLEKFEALTAYYAGTENTPFVYKVKKP